MAPVLVSENDAGPIEYAPDGRIKLPGHFRLRTPDGAQEGRHVNGRDFMDRPGQQILAIALAEVTLPLVARFCIDALLLGVGHHELSDVLEGRDRLSSLFRRAFGPRSDRCLWRSARGIPRLCPSVLQTDVGIGAEALVLSNAGHLVAQHPFFATCLLTTRCKPSPSLWRPGFAVCAPRSVSRACQSHIWSHISTRIVAYDGGMKDGLARKAPELLEAAEQRRTTANLSLVPYCGTNTWLSSSPPPK